MTLLDERPSGKLCVSYQKQTVVDAIDEIRATTQRIPNLDIAKVYRVMNVMIIPRTPDGYLCICNSTSTSHQCLSEDHYCSTVGGPECDFQHLALTQYTL